MNNTVRDVRRKNDQHSIIKYTERHPAPYLQISELLFRSVCRVPTCEEAEFIPERHKAFLPRIRNAHTDLLQLRPDQLHNPSRDPERDLVLQPLPLDMELLDLQLHPGLFQRRSDSN